MTPNERALLIAAGEAMIRNIDTPRSVRMRLVELVRVVKLDAENNEPSLQFRDHKAEPHPHQD
jgi:hypothetical protein